MGQNYFTAGEIKNAIEHFLAQIYRLPLSKEIGGFPPSDTRKTKVEQNARLIEDLTLNIACVAGA